MTKHLLGKKQPAIDNQVANHIFRQLDWESLQAAARVNKDWRSAIFQPFFTTFETVLGQAVRLRREGTVTQTVAELPALFAGKEYSYQALNEQANQLAHYLLSLNLPAESRIGLYMSQSLEYVVSVLAVMKTGLCFVPLSANPQLPAQRLVDYATGCDIKLVLTTSVLSQQPLLLTELMRGIPCKCVDTLGLQSQPKTNPERQVKAEQLAYILNTSGSTGKPKKVLIEHKGLNYCMLAHHEALKITSADRVAAFADISFDAHIVEIMMTLGQGACLYMVPFEQRTDLTKLAKYYQTHAISVAIFTPSMLRELNPNDFPQLRVIISTGEKLDTETLSRWCKEGRDAKSPRLFLNGYGPSEVTIATTLGVSKPGEAIHIGKPLAGLEVFILEQGPKDLKAPKRMPVGEEGEIYIAGFGLARGYLDEDLTKQRFRVIAHPDKPDERIRVFQTRDAGRITAEGKIEILGRLDRQLKVYGQLVYPEEVEAVLKEDTNVEQVYVDAKINQYGHPQFIAYLTLKDKAQPLDLAQLYKTAVMKLPPFMLPSRWYVVESIPFSASGKLDTQALQAMTLKPLYLQGPSEVKPQDKLERELADIWRQILRIEDSQFQFHVDDNFFHLGGTSLQAASLLQKLRSQYRLKLTPSEFMQAPTLAALVRRIQRQAGKMPTINEPVLLHTEVGAVGNNTPLFLVHSLIGDPEQDYAKLMEHWQSNRAVYGIKARGFANSQDMDETLQALAADYIKAMKKVQPRGPYLIGGWSAGGDIALVMAELLRSRGEEVALLMIDSEAITTFQAKSREEYAAYLLDLFEKKLKGQLEINEHGLDEAALAQWHKEKQVHVLFNRLASVIGTEDINFTYKQGLLATIKNILLGMLNHRVAANSQGLLITAQKTVANLKSPRLQWPEFVKFDEVISLAGDHESILLSDEGAKQLLTHIQTFCAKQQAQFTLQGLRTHFYQVASAAVHNPALASYLPLECYRKGGQRLELALQVNEFLASSHKVLLLLGETGSGRTLFCQHLTQQLQAMPDKPLVLYIDLSRLGHPTHKLIEKKLQGYGFSKAEIQQLKAHQSFIFILDGYDKLKTGQYQNLYISNQLAEWQTKTIITCRRSYFASTNDYRLHFVPNVGLQKDEQGLQEIELAPFSPAQIEHYLNQQAKSKDSTLLAAYKKYLNMLPALTMLTEKPLWLRLFIELLPKLNLHDGNIPNQEWSSYLWDALIADYFDYCETQAVFAQSLPADGSDVKQLFTDVYQQLALALTTGKPLQHAQQNYALAQAGALVKRDEAQPSRWVFLEGSLQTYFAANAKQTQVTRQSTKLRAAHRRQKAQPIRRTAAMHQAKQTLTQQEKAAITQTTIPGLGDIRKMQLELAYAIQAQQANCEQQLESNRQFLQAQRGLMRVNARLYLFNDPGKDELEAHQVLDERLTQLITNLTQINKTTTGALQVAIDYQLQELTIASLVNQAQWQHKLRHYKSAPQDRSALESIKQALAMIERLPPAGSAYQALERKVLRMVALSWQAKSQALAGHPAVALASYQEAIEQAQGYGSHLAILYSCMGALLNDMARHEEALRAHKKAYGFDSRDEGIRLNRAYGMRMLAKAQEERLSEENNTLARQTIAILKQDARIDLAKLTETAVGAQQSQAYLYLGIVWMDEGDTSAALDNFMAGLEIQSDHPTLLRRKALALADQGRFLEAHQALSDAERVLKRHEHIPAYATWLSNIQPRLKEFEAHNAYQQGDLKKALQCFKDAHDLETQPQLKQQLLHNIKLLEPLTKPIVASVVTAKELKLMSHYEYAVLSQQVYSLSQSTLPKGWLLWGQQEEPQWDYAGAIFVNHETRDIVVAHRGGASGINTISDARLMLNQPNEYMKCVNRLALQAEQLVQKGGMQGYRLSHTGHSLGGAVAEFLAYHYQREAVTFESPGIRDVLERLTEANSHSGLDEQRAARITAYVAEPNLANTARPHIGKLFRVYTLTKPNENAFLWGYLPKLWLVGDVFKTLERLAMVPLLETFAQAYNANRPVLSDKLKARPSDAIFGGYKTYERYAIDKDYRLNHLSLHELNPSTRNFLQGYQTPGNTYYQKNPYRLDERVLAGYRLEGEMLILTNGLTESEFKQYMERKLQAPLVTPLVSLGLFSVSLHTKTPQLQPEGDGALEKQQKLSRI